MITKSEKESIITEKLTTGITYRELSEKYGISFQTIHQWVQNYQGIMRSRTRKRAEMRKKKAKPAPPANEKLLSEIELLKEELRKSKLMNEVLNEVINVAEEELKISIRKKSGAK
jgi:transposase-like protein